MRMESKSEVDAEERVQVGEENFGFISDGIKTEAAIEGSTGRWKRNLLWLSLLANLVALGMMVFHSSNKKNGTTGATAVVQSEEETYNEAATNILDETNPKGNPEQEEQVHFPEDKNIKLYYAKTHKTGSTVMFSITARYAWEHNATVALPHGKRTFYSIEKYLDTSMIRGQGPFQMAMFHGVFGFKDNEHDKELVRQVFGTQRPFTMTIMRDPATTVPSAMYFWFGRMIVSNDFAASFEAMKQKLTPFFNSPGKTHFPRTEAKYHYLRDGMAYDLGLLADDESKMTRGYSYEDITEAFMQKRLEHLDGWLDFAVINEHLDESLILLRDELATRGFHTELGDFLYVSQNIGGRHHKAQKGEAEKKLEQDIRKWARFDTLIYQHFLKRFEEKVEAFGRDRLDAEVAKFRDLQKKVMENCLRHAHVKHTDASGLPVVYRTGMPKLHGSSSLCRDLFTRDTAFVRNFINRQN